MQPRARLLAPLADAVCLCIFVVAGRQSHDLSSGPGWFLTVVWPFLAGWFLVALVVRTYVAPPGGWLRLVATIAGGVGVAMLLRVLITQRAAPPAFIVVALGFIAITTVAWRLAVRYVAPLLRPHR